MMKKTVIVMIMVVLGIMTSCVGASAHTELYRNTCTEDKHSVEKVSIVAWDYDGFRAEWEINKFDTEEVQYENGFDFGFELSSYLAQVDNNDPIKMDEHVMYCAMYWDGRLYSVVQCTGHELLLELLNMNIDNGIANL